MSNTEEVRGFVAYENAGWRVVVSRSVHLKEDGRCQGAAEAQVVIEDRGVDSTGNTTWTAKTLGAEYEVRALRLAILGMCSSRIAAMTAAAKSEANTEACLNPQCCLEGLPFVHVPGGLCPRCGSQLSSGATGASGSGPPADPSARFRIRLIRYADTISAFEIEGVRGAWTWILLGILGWMALSVFLVERRWPWCASAAKGNGGPSADEPL